MSTPPRLTASAAIREGVKSVVVAPFRTLIVLSILVSWTLLTFSRRPTGFEIALSLLLLVAGLYIQIAIILAAGRPDPAKGADPWLRAAIRRRCLWRFVATSLMVVLGLLFGALLLVVGAFFVGALLALAQIAAVLERRVPMDAIARGASLGKDARLPLGIVFSVFVFVPTAAVETTAALGWAEEIGYVWPVVLAVAEVISAIGAIALTRMFVALGGQETPPLEQIAPPRATAR